VGGNAVRRAAAGGLAAVPAPTREPAGSPEHAYRIVPIRRSDSDTDEPSSFHRWLRHPAFWISLIVAGIGLLLIFAIRPESASQPVVRRYVQLTNDSREKPIKSPIVTDGKRVYFTEEVPSGYGIASVSVEGGETVSLPTPLISIGLMDIAPNGNELLVAEWHDSTTFYPDATDNQLLIMPLPGGSPRPLGNLKAHSAAWAPDGRTLAYARGQDILVASADGTGTQRLTRVDGAPFWLRWSPDGRVIRFTVTDVTTHRSSIRQIGRNGGPVQVLLPSRSSPNSVDDGDWTSDGKYYFFNSGDDLWAMRETSNLLPFTSTRPMRLTGGPIRFDAVRPSPKPDRLFCVGMPNHLDILRYDNRTGQFTVYVAGRSIGSVEVSPDGEWIAYASDNALWRSRLDGSDAIRLTFAPWQISAPRWSPDGQKIAFRALNSGSPYRIWLASSRGGQLEELVPGDSGVEQGFPSWSADGSRIVFGEIPIPSRKNDVVIRVVELATRQVSVLPGSRGLWTPRWSPDGQHIAAVTVEGCRLKLFDFSSRTWRELGGLADQCINDVRWSRDGKYLYLDGTSNEPAVYRMQVRDGKVEKVVSLKAGRWRGNWVGLGPLDAPLVERSVGAQEVYALDVELR
jgi:Tol biopolymer transport system component